MRWLLCGFMLATSANLAFAQSTKGKEAPKVTAADVAKYSGKTFEQWLKEFSSKDPSRRENAIRAICLFPPETSIKALPIFLAELRKHTPNTPIDLSVRCHLCIGIGQMFASGERIDPKNVNDAVALLKLQLRDQQLILRYRAITALAAVGPDASSAIPELLNVINEPTTYELRQAAAAALGVIANQGTRGPRPEVMQPLYGRLQDSAMQVRIAAVQALTWLGPANGDTEGYVSALLPVALKDPEPGLQIWARVAIIAATNDFSNSNISPIVKHMASEDVGVRVQAIQAIGTMGPKAKLGIPGLTRALNDTEPLVLASAMWGLGRMESSAGDAISILQKISADPNQSDYMKKMAKDTVAKITGEKAIEK